MNKQTLYKLLKDHSPRSQWEYTNFVLEPYGEFTGRAILSQMQRLAELEDVLDQTVEGSMTIGLAHERDQIARWLDQFSPQEIEQHLMEIESKDADYWVQRLGREAAVDMVCRGRIGESVLSRAILLDEGRYRQFSETCNTILKVVGDVTRDVEEKMGLYPQLPEGEPR